jgi:hypothetical protein
MVALATQSHQFREGRADRDRATRLRNGPMEAESAWQCAANPSLRKGRVRAESIARRALTSLGVGQRPTTAVPPLLNANIGVPASRLAPWL